MADDASRLQHLTDVAFLALFQQKYPQPTPWKMLTLPPEVVSKLISALASTTLIDLLPRRTDSRKAAPSPTGVHSPRPKVSMKASSTCERKKPNSPTCLSSASDTGKCLSELTPLAAPSWRWARGSPTWVSRIRDFSPRADNFIPYSMLSSKACVEKTTPNKALTPSTSTSSGNCVTTVAAVPSATWKTTPLTSSSPASSQSAR